MPRPSTFPLPWSQLADRCGGVVNLSIILKVNRSTLARWAQGAVIPSPSNVLEITHLFHSNGLTPPSFQ